MIATESPELEQENDPFLPASEPAPAVFGDPPEALRFRIIVIAFVFVFFIEAGITMIVAPMTRIQESIECRNYYLKNDPSVIPSSGEIAEDMCKKDQIQSELALVRGLSDLFDGLVGLSLAVPYGNMADKSRRRVLRLILPAAAIYLGYSTIVMWFTNIFPLRAIWLASFAFVIGGGPAVISAVIWTVVADVATEKQRTNAFLQIGVISMAAEVVSTAGSAFLMKFDPWIAWFGGCAVLMFGTCIAMTIPETLNLFASETTSRLDQRDSPEPDDVSDFELDDLDKIDQPPPMTHINVRSTSPGPTAKLRGRLAYYRSESDFIFQNKPVLILLLTFFVYKISRGAAGFFIQYVSTRYSWTLANANYLVSMRSFLNIIVFTALLPWGTWYLTQKKRLPARDKDFLLAKLSVLALLIGTVGIGLSDSVPPLILSIIVQTCGMGFAFLIRSIITTMVEPKQVARLYVGITILETMGALAAAPLSAWLFRWGLYLGGPWLGIPHMITGVIFAITAVGVWWVARANGVASVGIK